MKVTLEEAKAALKKAKDEMVRYYNQCRIPAPVFYPGDKVYLDASDIQTTCPSKKLSHQHLGGGRSGSPYGRQGSPNPTRPRTADNRSYGYGSQGGSVPRPSSLYDEEAPQRNPGKYSENVEKQAMMSKSLINTFFKDSVQRARDRNQR